MENGENYKGVYFTKDLTQDRISAFLGSTVNNYHARGFSARGIRFDFSFVDSQTVLNVMSKSLGFVLMRTDREPVCISEGLMLPVMSHTNEKYSENRLGYANRPGLASGIYNAITLFGHLENIPEDARDWHVNAASAATLARTLQRDRDLALLFRSLATLRTDIRLFTSVEELRWRGPTPGFEAFGKRLDAALTDKTGRGRSKR